MAEENKQSNDATPKLFKKIITSPWLVSVCLALAIVFDLVVQKISSDLSLVIIAIIIVIVLVVLLVLMWFLSFLMRREREDIISGILKEGGLLDDYLKPKIDGFNDHGKCLTDLQKECKKRIEQNFFKTTEEVKIYDIDEILDLEKEVHDGVIWIISDELRIDVDKEKVFDTITTNLKDGTVYKYFHTKNNLDAISRIKRKFEINGIIDIENKVSFTQVSDRYDALLTITKDVIILNPDEDNRNAFVCIYSDNNFNMAFYRKLDANEIEGLCNIIRNNKFTNVVSEKDVVAFSKLQNQLDRITKNLAGNLEDIQSQYIDKFNQEPEILNKYVESKRSGELKKPNYYTALHSAANFMLKEKNKANDSYKGEIWALSLCLLNEWNEDDEYEKKWLSTLLKMDKLGIKTRRLYVFDDDTLGLDPFNDKGKILLEQIDIYCTRTTSFENTQSYAISKSEIDISDDVEFDRGFFAMNLEYKRIFLIYDVAEEKINEAKEPCGEIDYNNARKRNIHNKWESYLKKAIPLNKYLQEKSSEEAIQYMKSHNFNIDEQE